ncbi:MAG: hypothetical protein VX617_04520 [Pseudomonadota bacterium]|nr:hypothetical protein [Pseudomonadota bacterium]
MKLPLPTLIGIIVMFYSLEAWCLPPCGTATAKSMLQTQGWDSCHGNLYFETGRFRGDKYVGEFKDGRGHGQGTYIWVYEDKYVGEFRNGIAHGKGTYTSASGKVITGIWENGQFLYLTKP